MLTSLPEYQALSQHYSDVQQTSMRQWFEQNPNRFTEYTLQAAGITLDYSKNRVACETMQKLADLARARFIPEAIEAMFKGDLVNPSEGRPALHTALRNFSDGPVMVDGKDVMPEVRKTLTRMKEFCWRIRNQHWRGFSNKPFTDVVSIGIGGSFLGPKLASQALKPYWGKKINCHYLANIDGSNLTEVLQGLNPETTLFIVQSKSFGTQETLKNAIECRQWFLDNGGQESDLPRHFTAVTANVEKAKAFGINEKNIFPMWDWVGGRYSLWSAIGLPLMLTIGHENFKQVLQGAHEMDVHFRTAPLEQNMPVIMAMLGVWYINFFNAQSHAILPYDHYLRGLPAHIQQLDMESNGKSVDIHGSKLNYQAGPIIWGGVGSNGQHAYHQLLHQGTQFVPCDFIMPLQTHNPVDSFHELLISNCLSQSQALMQGKTLEEAKEELRKEGKSEREIAVLAPQKVIPGNRPSNTIFFDKANPKIVGALIALYEHKVFVQGKIWDINSFDQWGVELGKQLGNQVHAAIQAEGDTNIDNHFDASTLGLIKAFRSMKHKL
ncbi:glucose-6-phosphate isomerase [Bermanella marisrubri]|uniref:Glucose-6-phosphate isomerase n=1 Tax=Bermanella marisrubri TaxID=207949 RepID=Q1N5C9_9GAMM|nr:glucose-6-phosphate isomerase [Bermanella marisrubri]EAT13128.1 glucose-6-phosphate isomerase [Oceanobacter sp. RED65] [Bermanella marisrubri]QIZ83905.1 glucose-6-phosphate isomerase [Bermanella marisrubri]